MSDQKQTMCPLFPDVPCPQGVEASEECKVRVNGDFDPVMYFRDQLLMHCAVYRSRQQSAEPVK